jgi:cysteine-rich repeat protein
MTPARDLVVAWTVPDPQDGLSPDDVVARRFGVPLVPACGDGVVDAGEACDDGNQDDLDGCSSDCRREGGCCSNGPGTDSECVIATEVACFTGDGLYLGDGTECETDLDCVALVVTFDSISAAADRGGVVVRWTTIIEVDTVAFRVLRETPSSNREKRLSVVAERIPAAGNSLGGAQYEIRDDAKEAALAVSYYIEDVDIHGRVTRHGPVPVDRGVREGTEHAVAPRVGR